MKIKAVIISLLIVLLLLAACQAEESGGDQNDGTDTISGLGEFVITSVSDDNYVIYHDGEEQSVDENYIPVFVNGELVKYAGILHNGHFLVQIGIASELLGTELINDNGSWSIENDQHAIKFVENKGMVEVNEDSESIIIENTNDSTYIDLEALTSRLDWVVSYYHKDMDEDHQSLVRHNHAIYLDQALKEEMIETEEAGLQLAKELATEALENFTASLRENLEESGEDPTRMDSSLEIIEDDIHNMAFVSEVSKYYMYDMDVYRVFVDRTNGDVYVNYDMGRAAFMVLVDLNDPHLFTPLYLIG
ncbi:hypothetical protein [Bacillus horti]|nr:hypothetical protein [Bacillus horti]